MLLKLILILTIISLVIAGPLSDCPTTFLNKCKEIAMGDKSSCKVSTNGYINCMVYGKGKNKYNCLNYKNNCDNFCKVANEYNNFKEYTKIDLRCGNYNDRADCFCEKPGNTNIAL